MDGSNERRYPTCVTYVMCAGSSFGVLKAKQNSSSGARVTDKVATVDDTNCANKISRVVKFILVMWICRKK